MKAIPHLVPLNPRCGVFCSTSTDYAKIPYPHYHEACELFIILEGQHEVRMGEECLLLKAGDVLLMRGNIPHERRAICPGKYMAIAFRMDELKRLAKFMDDLQGCAQNWWMCTAIQQEVDSFVQTIERINLYSVVSPGKVNRELRGLLAVLWLKFTASPDRETMPTWLVRLKEQMQNPDALQKGLEALLSFSPYSHAYLCREFQRILGCTPTDYVNSLRLDYAHLLLENTAMAVADIALESGFESLSYFYRLFKSKYGIAPARYRKLRFVSKAGCPREQYDE